MRFDDRVVVITGAGPGLGAAMARGFTERGARTVLVARSAASLAASSAAARSVGGAPVTVAADLTTVDGARSVADRAMAAWGRIDVLVNAAFGAPPRRLLLEMDDAALADWRRVVDTGGATALLATRFVAPHMVAAGTGAIVNVTSMSSRVAFAGRSDYGAGKAVAHKLAQALAEELGPHGVRVNCVAPGHIRSGQLEAFYRQRATELGTSDEAVMASYTEKMALGRIPTADEVANAVVFLASDLASAITGAVLDVNAGHFMTL